jgi:hypothetical protein
MQAMSSYKTKSSKPKRIRTLIKKLFLVCLLFLLFSGCKTSTTDYSFYTKESYITTGRYIIKGAGGEDQGYLQQSKIDFRRIVQYDKNGNEVGYWQKSPIDLRKSVFTRKKF